MNRIYGIADHKQHLLFFISALTDLIAEDSFQREFPAEVVSYNELIDCAREFLEYGFTQDDLVELSLAFTPTFYTDRTWCPPLIEVSPGKFTAPEWFDHLDKLHKKCVDAAFDLRCSGEVT